MKISMEFNRRGVCVDRQLTIFQDDLFNSLEFQLLINTNRTFWEEFGELDVEAVEGIDFAVENGFEDIMVQYRGIPTVTTILEHMKDTICTAVYIAMNVPYPQDVDSHVDRIVINLRNVYYDVWYANLRTEMIVANHNIEVLQRNWRRSISDPNYLACRRRLFSEAQELIDI